jgi:hypothetical protein
MIKKEKFMKNKILWCALGICMMPNMQVYTAAGRDITTNSQILTCNGKDVKCNYTLNAVSDLKEIAVAVPAHNLRAIATPRTISIELPGIGGQKLFQLMLTQPFSSEPLDRALVRVPMEVLFVSSVPDAEAYKEMPDAVSMVKIYRRTKGEQLWTERGTILIDADVSDTLPITIVLHPNGVVDFIENGKPKELYLGQAV